MHPSPQKTNPTEVGESSCLVFFDPSGQVVYANEHFRDIIPLSKNGSLDLKGHSILSSADRKRMRSIVQECLKTPGQERSVGFPTDTVEGEKTCQWRFTCLSDKADHILGVLGERLDQRSRIANRSRELLATELLDKVADAIILTDPEFRIMIWNATAEEHYGIPATEAIGKKFTDIVKFEQTTTEYQVMQMSLETTGEWNGEVSFTKKDGERMTVWIRSKLVKDTDGKFIGFMGIGRDITDMKRASQNVRERASLLHNLSEAVAYMDLDMHIHTINRAGEELFGVTEKEALGREMPELVGIQLSAGLDIESLGEILLKDNRWEGDLDLIRPDGKTVHLHGSVVTIRNDRDEPIGYLTVCRDITEILQARDDRNLRDLVLGNIRDGVVTTDSDNRIINFNTNAGRIFGVPLEGAIGKRVEEIVSLLHQPKATEVEARMKQEGFWSGRASFLRHDSRTVTLELRSQPILDHSGKFLAHLTVMQDITAKVLDEERQRQHLDLLNNIEDIIISTDTEFKITAVNKAAEKILQIQERDVVGKLEMEAIPYTFLTDNLWKATRVLKETGRWQGRVAFPLADGRLIYLATLITAVKNSAGKTTGYIEVHRNITERIESEKRERYNAILLDNIEDAVVTFDHEFRIVSVNKAAESMYDVRAMDVTGTMVRESIPWDLISTDDKNYQHAIILTGHWSGEASYLRQDGSRIFISAITNRITGDQGEIVGFVTVSRNITSKKEEEQRQQFNTLLLNSMTDAVVTLDRNLNVLYMNPAAEKLSGLLLEDIKGKIGVEIMAAEYVGLTNEIVLTEVLEKGIWTGHAIYTRPDGRKLDLLTTFNIIKDAKGEFDGIIAVNKDISGEIAEDMRRQTQDKILDNMSDTVVTMDMDLKVTYVNKATLLHSGLKKEDIIGKKGSEVLPLEYDDIDRSTLMRKLLQQGSWTGNTRYRKPDDTLVPMSTTYSVIRDEKGEPSGVVVVSKDVSHQKAIEENQRYNTLLMNNITDGVVSLDDHFNLVSMNPAAERMFDDLQQHARGKNVNEVYDMEYLDQGLPEITQIVLREGTWSGKTILHRKDGFNLNLSAVFNAIRNPEGKLTGFIGTFRDITDKVDLERRQKLVADLMERVSDAVAYYDQDLRIQYVNKTAEDMLDIISEEVLGKRSVDSFRLDYINVDREKVNEELGRRGYWHGDAQYIRPDGRILQLHLRHRVIRDLKGSISGYISNITDVTELMDAQKAQRVAAVIMENIDDAIGYFDPELRVIYLNPASKKILGVELKQAIGRIGTEVFPMDYVDTDFESIHATLNDIGEWSGEGYYVHPDGRRLYLSLRFTRIVDAKGTTTGHITTARDITEKADMDRQIRFNAMLLDKISEGVVASDKDFRVIYMNPSAQSLTGVDFQTVGGKLTTEAVDLYYPGAERQEVLRIIREVGSWTGEASCLKPDGTLISMILTHARYHDDQGRHAGFITVGRDITELRRTWDKLEDMSLIAQKTQNSVIISDELERIIWVNEGFTRHTGYSLQEALGKTTIELLTGPSTDPETITQIRRQLTRREPLNAEYRMRTKGGQYRWIRVEGQPVFDQHGEFKKYFRIQTDIDSERAHLDELENLSMIARHTNSMVAISDPNDKVIWVNNAFTLQSGYSLAETRGKSTIELFAGPNSSQDVIKKAREKMSKYESYRMDNILYLKNGQHRWFSIENIPLLDKDGKLKKYLRLMTDVHEAKEKSEELDMLSLIARHTEGMVIFSDENDRIEWVNNGFLRKTGYAIDEILGKTSSELLLGPDTDKNNLAKAIKMMFIHEPVSMQNILYTKMGRPLWFRIEGRPVFDEDGRFRRYFRILTDIQDIKDKEWELAENQRRLEDLFNTRFEAMAILDREGRILNMNDRAEETSHRKKEELIGKFPWDHDFTKNNENLASFFRNAVDTCKQGKAFHEEFKLQIPDGGIEIQVFSFRPVTDAFGNLDYIQMEVSDVTEKESAKRASQYNEQLFNAYMKNSPVPAWITSLDGRIENMNERFREFIGKDESVIGLNMLEVIDHTYLAQYRQHNEVVVKTQKPLQAIEYALDKNKVVHTFLNTRFPIFEDGKLTKIGGMGMDITGILKAEEERNDSIKRFEAVSRATDDMIWEWDVARDKITWQGENKRSWEHELRTGEDMKHFLGFLHKDDRDMVESSLRRAVKNRNKDRWQAEYRMKGSQGEDIFILDRAVILRDIEGNASRMIGAMQDISDRVNMEKDFVRQREDEHKRTTRMIFDAQEAERSRLAADLHDNVNPLLAAARLHINAAEATTDDPAPYLLQSKALIHEGIEEIRKISHNLSNTLINEIGLEDLVLSSLRKLNPDETLDVHTDFRKLDLLKPATSMKLNVIRIIQEQVHNTLKYAQASNLYIKLQYRDKTLLLTIQDDGLGFDPKSLRTGIGLANIKNRVESYNGKMKLTSSPGKGCKMEIQLPTE